MHDDVIYGRPLEGIRQSIEFDESNYVDFKNLNSN